MPQNHQERQLGEPLPSGDLFKERRELESRGHPKTRTVAPFAEYAEVPRP